MVLRTLILPLRKTGKVDAFGVQRPHNTGEKDL
jgi:hypothetical protein